MAQGDAKRTGPDLSEGIALAELADGGKLVGYAGVALSLITGVFALACVFPSLLT
jgi:hypothetical protein